MRRIRVAAASSLVFVALATACSSSGDARSGAASTAASTTSTEHADCAPPGWSPASGDAKFTFGGVERAYALSLPAGYDGTTASPLVFSLHGFISNKETMERTTAMAATGARRGYVVVTPDSIPPEWNTFRDPARADDYGFVHALLAELETRLCVDPARVYAAGHSNGSAFAGLLVCDSPFDFAGVAMVSATTPSTCPDDRHPAVIAVSGTADSQVPYAGGNVGGGGVVIPPALDTIAAYATKYGCDPTPAIDAPAPEIERRRYANCDGTALEFVTVIGGAHPWPRSDAFSATDEIFDFFDARRG